MRGYRTVRGTSPELRLAARSLRREQTAAEALLWEALRGRRMAGLRFRRQHAVGQFVLDFYCPERQLVVEVDGGVHDTPEQVARDAARTEQLAAAGYVVLRVRNERVFNGLASVLAQIAAAVSAADVPAVDAYGEQV